MIKNREPLSMAEVLEYTKKEKESSITKFIKKFSDSTIKAGEMREKLQRLNLIKLKPEHISKIIDLMPENQEELNKIFTDISLDEDETKKILDTIKEFK